MSCGNILRGEAFWSGWRSLAGDEGGSVAAEAGYCGIVFAALLAGMIAFGGLFSDDIATDLEAVTTLVAELTSWL